MKIEYGKGKIDLVITKSAHMMKQEVKKTTKIGKSIDYDTRLRARLVLDDE